MLPKQVEFQRYLPYVFCTTRYDHQPSKNKFQTQKKPEKKNLGRRWAKIGLRKVIVRSGEISGPRQTSMDEPNDCAMKCERGALARGSDPPSGHSVHNTAGDTWRAPTRRLIQNIRPLLFRKQTTKIINLSDGKKYTCLLYTSPSPRDS